MEYNPQERANGCIFSTENLTEPTESNASNSKSEKGNLHEMIGFHREYIIHPAIVIGPYSALIACD
eukprot:scaffold9412_cov263-Amphora_coffeaeformis.AAC.2